jgi:GNAT superfamily N-acetyltransferase
MSARVRLSQSGDRDAIVELILQLNRFEAPISGDRLTDRDTARRCLRDNEEAVRNTLGLSIVAEKDGAIVGYLCLAVESIGSFVREDVRRVGYVRELVVDEAHRGAGVGADLMAEAESFARSRRIGRMMLGVLAGNDRGRKFYESFGLRAYAVEMVKDLG